MVYSLGTKRGISKSFAMRNYYKNDLKGKTVVITGASSGVGRAAAEAFAKEGCNLVLAARGKEALEEIAFICRNLGAITLSVPTDVSDSEQVQKLTEEALSLNGKIEVWVNNAGVMASGKFEDIPVEIMEQLIKTNLLGYLYGARAVFPIFKKQKRGVLINNISIGGFIPAPYSAAYTASKFGIRGLAEGLQAEVAHESDIHVCSLYPGLQKSTGNMHSSKYSGLDFKVPPFASDPKVLAESMVETAKNPRREVYPNLTSWPLVKVYRMFPRLIGSTTTAVMRKMMKKTSGGTEGNILKPSEGPMQIYGETMSGVPSKKTKGILLAGMALTAGLLLLKAIRK